MKRRSSLASFATRLSGVVALALVASCGSLTGPSDEQINESRQKWIDANLSDYTVVVTRSEGGSVTIPVRITVVNKVVTARVYDDTGDPVAAADAEDYPDVDGLFDVVVNASNAGLNWTATFNGVFGYPVFIQVDYLPGSFSDDLVLGVTDFSTP